MQIAVDVSVLDLFTDSYILGSAGDWTKGFPRVWQAAGPRATLPVLGSRLHGQLQRLSYLLKRESWGN